MREKLGFVLIFLFAACIKTDISRRFPGGFWPELTVGAEGKCPDLTGLYQATTFSENGVTEYAGVRSTGFPPGLTIIDGSEFRVIQEGCGAIAIDYEDRFHHRCRNLVTEERNGIKWDPKEKLFSYKVTAFEPDGFAGTTLFRNDVARFGKGKDGSFLCEERIHTASRLFGIRSELKANQKYKFKFIRNLTKAELAECGITTRLSPPSSGCAQNCRRGG